MGSPALRFVKAYPALTVRAFQKNAATGTFNVNPQNINDNNTANWANGNAVGMYCQILFPFPATITQYRLYGDVSNNLGVVKFQYLSLANVWTDWIAGIVPHATATWSAWVAGTMKRAKGIRVAITATPTVYIRELEVKY